MSGRTNMSMFLYQNSHGVSWAAQSFNLNVYIVVLFNIVGHSPFASFPDHLQNNSAPWQVW